MRTKQTILSELLLHQLTIALSSALAEGIENGLTNGIDPEEVAKEAHNKGIERLAPILDATPKETLVFVCKDMLSARITQTLMPIILIHLMSGDKNPGKSVVETSEAAIRKLNTELAAMQ